MVELSSNQEITHSVEAGRSWRDVIGSERSRLQSILGAEGKTAGRNLIQDKDEATATITGIKEQIAKGGSSHLQEELREEQRRLEEIERRISSVQESLSTLDRFQRYFEETPRLIDQRDEITDAINGLREQIQEKGGAEKAGPLAAELRNEESWLSRTNQEINALVPPEFQMYLDRSEETIAEESSAPRESREVLEENQREAEETIKGIEAEIAKGGSSHLQKELAEEQRRLSEIKAKLEFYDEKDKTGSRDRKSSQVVDLTKINSAVIEELAKIAERGDFFTPKEESTQIDELPATPKEESAQIDELPPTTLSGNALLTDAQPSEPQAIDVSKPVEGVTPASGDRERNEGEDNPDIIDGTARVVENPVHSEPFVDGTASPVEVAASTNEPIAEPTVEPTADDLKNQKRARLDELEKILGRGQLTNEGWDELARLRKELASESQKSIIDRIGGRLKQTAVNWWRSVSPQGRNKLAWGVGVGLGIVEGFLFQEFLPSGTVAKGLLNIAIFNGISYAIDRVYTRPVRELRDQITAVGSAGELELKQKLEAKLEMVEGKHSRFKAFAADCAAGVAAGSIAYIAGRILYSGIEAAIQTARAPEVPATAAGGESVSQSVVTPTPEAPSVSPEVPPVSPTAPVVPEVEVVETIVPVTEKARDDFFSHIFRIPETPDATGTFWSALRAGAPVPGEIWKSPFGPDKAEIVRDMVVKFARYNGHSLIMPDGQEFVLRNLLTPEQIGLINQAIRTEDYAEYASRIMPVFQYMLKH